MSGARVPRVMTPERDAEARRLAAAKRTLLEAAQEMGLNHDTLRSWARRRKVRFVDARLDPLPRPMTERWRKGLERAREADPNAARRALREAREARLREAVARLRAQHDAACARREA